jgi:4-hydroxybenzoate polyprenyltransferase
VLAWGAQPAMRLASGITALTVALMPVPYLALNFGGLYLLVGLATAVVLARALAGAVPENARHASAALKTAMMLGIVALALGRLAP